MVSCSRWQLSVRDHWVLLLLPLMVGGLPAIAQAQSIVPAGDGTNTLVQPQGNTYTIDGGQFSRDGNNRFHRFSQFGLNPGETANFLATPSLQNILGRVTGGDPSIIQGLIRVTGGNANLYLINPAGIIFGANARLDVGGSFLATTANGVRFGNGGWFDALGTNDYASLVGTPQALTFGTNPGTIINAGNLAVGQGQNLSLLGDTVVSTGTLTAPGGQVTIAAVPGSNLVRFSQSGSLLSLEFAPPSAQTSPSAPSLPQLLTGTNIGNATGLTIAPNGTVQLTGSGLVVNPGDVAIAGQITSGNISLSSAQNLTIASSQLQATGDLHLTGDRIQMRDSGPLPLQAVAGGTLSIQGNQGIDLFALNHSASGLAAGGNIALRSNGAIVGDAHFFSGGSVRFERLDGSAGNVFSPSDPVILAIGDVTLGNYTGASLHILAGGSVTLGNVTITGVGLPASTINPANTTLFNGVQTLGSLATVPLSSGDTITIDGSVRPTLDIRAGVNWAQLGGNPIPDPFLLAIPPLAPTAATTANITTGSIQIDLQNNAQVLLTNRYAANGFTGSITTGAINASTQNNTWNGGSITLDSRGNILTGELRSDTFAVGSFNEAGNGGAIALNANGNMTTGAINSRAASNFTFTDVGSGGNVTLSANGNIVTGDIISDSEGRFGIAQNAGAIRLTANGSILTGILSALTFSQTTFAFTSSAGNGGAVTLSTLGTPVNGNITFDRINTTAIAPAGTRLGGNVQILANGLVRGTGLDTNTTRTINTESAVNGQAGTVVIQHDGGPNNLPFTLNDASLTATNGNGLRGTIGGLSTLTTGSFPVLPTGGVATNTPAGITIRSVNSPPSLSAPAAPTLNTQSGQSVTFTLAQLGFTATDPNNDTRVFGIGAIATGTLTVNGSVVTDGFLPIAPNDTLVYTPAPNTQGISNAFTIVASDLNNAGAGNVQFLSQSNALSVRVNVIAPPIVEPPIARPPVFPPDLTTTLLPPDQPEALPTVVTVPTTAIDSGIAAIEDQISGEFSGYLDLPDQPRTVTLSEAQTTLGRLEAGTTVKPAIVYVTFTRSSTGNQSGTNLQMLVPQDNDQLQLILVTNEGAPTVKLVPEATRTLVRETAIAFREEVADPSKTRTQSYLPTAQQLYQWFIAPLESTLQTQNIQNLAFILDTGLRFIPLAAMHDGKGFLIEKYSIGLLPSLSLTDTRLGDIRAAQVLAGGASVFADQNPLPSVPVELANIATQLWRGNTLLNEAFTLNNLKQQRQQQPFGIIHLATHGEFLPGDLSHSYIQLWDTRLHLDQIRELGWNSPPTELVVLSACQMAVDDANAELGFAGFAVQAGAKSALASLWNVSDEGTTGLMSEFYTQLKTVPIKAEALRRAQLAMVREQITIQNGQLQWSGGSSPLPTELNRTGTSRLSHPYYWSAFTMIGSPW